MKNRRQKMENKETKDKGEGEKTSQRDLLRLECVEIVISKRMSVSIINTLHPTMVGKIYLVFCVPDDCFLLH